MVGFNKIFFLVIAFCFNTFLVFGETDSLEYQKQIETINKYLKLSKDEQFQLSERKLFTQKAINIAEKLNNSEALMLGYSNMGYIDAQQGHYAEAFKIFSRLEKMSDSVGYHSAADWRRKAYIANIVGLLYKELGEYNKALEHYYKSLTISDSINWDEGSAAALNNISVLYNINGNTEQAISILKDSWEISKKKNLQSLLLDISINLQEMYVKLGLFDSVIYYGNKAYEIAKQGNSPYDMAFVELGFGKLYIAEKKYLRAIESINKVIEIANTNDYGEIKLESLLELSKALRLNGNLDSCRSALKEASRIDSEINIPSLHIKYLLQLSKYYETIRDFEAAFKYHLRATQLQDSINKNWEKVKYSELEALNQIKLEKQKNEVLKKNLSLKQLQFEHQRLILIISVGSLIILLWLFILFYRKRKFELKTNKILSEKNKKIIAQENIIRIKNEESLKQELDYKNRQLTSFSLSALKQSESLDMVFNELREIINQQNIKPATRKKLERMVQLLKPHYSEKEWEEFRSYFEAVHPSFYTNLKKIAPDLTLNEQKICAYLRLGMNTKEIATITFRQVRSVESTRFRIRKKLGLTANENLYKTLEKF